MVSDIGRYYSIIMMQNRPSHRPHVTLTPPFIGRTIVVLGNILSILCFM